MVNPPIPLVAIVGPTAVGKTALSLRLAVECRGEIVNADSRQVYRGMDIGTGKPTPEEQAQAPHHLLDIVDPDDEFHVALYLELATQAIDDIHRRGGVPFLVGGTGHYVWALLEGLKVPQVPPDPTLRASLEEVSREQGGRERLLKELAALDPVAAARVDPKNIRRVIRAIEVSRATGRPFSQVGTKEPPPYRTLVLGLTMPRDALYRRIDTRVDAMVAAGWPDEVRALLAKGYGPHLPSFSSLGYREMAAFVRGEEGLPEAVARIKTQTHAFARRQYTWFKSADPRIQWLDISATATNDAREIVREFLAG